MVNMRRSNDSWYDVAQICLNGHVVNSLVKTNPNPGGKFCEDCGKNTITCCKECNHEIRGYYHSSNVFSYIYSAPNHCSNCGNPYPWTVSKTQALNELFSELEEISDADKDKLVKSIDDIITETPKTELASNRVKSILNKITPEHKEIVKSIGLKLICESAQKLIFGS